MFRVKGACFGGGGFGFRLKGVGVRFEVFILRNNNK